MKSFQFAKNEVILLFHQPPGLPKEPTLTKYRIEKADAGHKDVALVPELQWGDNPEGFVGWLADWLEKESKWRRWIGVIALVVIAVIFLLIK